MRDASRVSSLLLKVVRGCACGAEDHGSLEEQTVKENKCLSLACSIDVIQNVLSHPVWLFCFIEGLFVFFLLQMSLDNLSV